MILNNPRIPGSPQRELPGLVVGDKIGFTATYSSSTTRFGLNIEDAAGNYIFRLAFRQPTDRTRNPPTPVLIMNTWEGSWGKQFDAPFPELSDGDEMNVLIEAQEDKFVGYLNGAVMEDGVQIPARQRCFTETLGRSWR